MYSDLKRKKHADPVHNLKVRSETPLFTGQSSIAAPYPSQAARGSGPSAAAQL
jgi:hypothetical protein